MQIALFKGNSFISKLIKWQTRGQYSHAACMLSDGSVIESKEGVGVRRCEGGIRGTIGEVVDIFDVNITAAEYISIETFLNKQVGKRYDYLGILRFLDRHSDEDIFISGNDWFCSELVFAAFLQAGIKLLNRIEPWQVSPSMLSYSPLLVFNKQIIIGAQ